MQNIFRLPLLCMHLQVLMALERLPRPIAPHLVNCSSQKSIAIPHIPSKN